MKKVLAGLLVAGLVAFTGCNESKPGGPGVTTQKKDTPAASPRAGGYGADSPRAKPDAGRGDGDGGVVKTSTADKDLTFKVRGPVGETNLKQGEAKTVKFTISRGRNFAQPVKLTFKDNKKGLKFDPASPEVKPSDKEDLGVQVTAENDAFIGKHEVTVDASAPTGEPTTLQFTVDVKAK